jgi:uncharacterized protein with NAD-binding domain and iron-sulfur cluster
MSGPQYEREKTQVAIFGAGIAGLTAAHELIERGFQVEVYERDPPSVVQQATYTDEDPHLDCDVGGMARTQWGRVERDFLGGAPVNSTKPPGQSTQPPGLLLGPGSDGPRLLLAHVLTFAPGSVALTQEHKERIKEIAALLERNNIGSVEVRGYTDELGTDPYPSPDDAATKTRKDFGRAHNVKDALESALNGRGKRQGAVKVKVYASAFGLGRRDDWTCPNEKRNYVSFHVVEDWLPGEHGFRFFPAFYRHVFDTMGRTPIPDQDQPVYSETARTVLDNVKPTTFFGMSTNLSKKLLRFRRRPTASLQELFEQLQGELEALGHTIADIVRYQRMLFKFMTSCPRRRAAEYEDISWADFVGADQFTQNFQRYLESTAQVLVGLQASRCDARTYGNVSVQMVQDQLATSAHTDGTLNAPTSQAWFDPWRRYLEAQGVRFHRGTLKGFVFNTQDGQIEPWPVIEQPQWVPDPHDADGQHIETKRTVLLRDYYVLALPAKGLQDIAKAHPQLVGEDFDRLRDFQLGDPRQADPGGALDHMSGIQYYLDTDFTFLNGHIIFPDTPWKLSAISQPQFWMRKRGWWSGYRGILSVDISNLHSETNPAWAASKEEIAAGVWQQIIESTHKHLKSERCRKESEDEKSLVPNPLYYHLDDNLMLDTDDKPVENRSPYLLCRAGEYRVRPGEPGNYAVHFGRLVLAGTLMQTYTRLTTMEAANESGRHAVNAILDASTFQGERCAVWDPERNELSDLKFLLELDEQLFDRGLPHFAEIVDLRDLPATLLQSDTRQEVTTLVVRALERTGLHGGR